MRPSRFLPILMTAVMLAVAAWPPAGWTADKKLTLLTWNAPQNEPMFRAWMDEFKQSHPDVEFEWLDKKGSEWAAFYQTQLVAGTPPGYHRYPGHIVGGIRFQKLSA